MIKKNSLPAVQLLRSIPHILMMCLIIIALTGCEGLIHKIIDEAMDTEPEADNYGVEDPNKKDLNESSNEEPPPGVDQPAGSNFQIADPTIGAHVVIPTLGPNQNLGEKAILKPVRFSNVGTLPYTVQALTFITPEGITGIPSSASTVAFPGGNSSNSLLLPIGTYTWCYHWDNGDTDGDGMINYVHAYDKRTVILDVSDSDTLDFAETVTLAAPAGINELPGRCQFVSFYGPGTQQVSWHLSGAIFPPPYGTKDIPGSDTASTLTVNQAEGNTEITISAEMDGLAPNTEYTVYISNSYDPSTGWISSLFPGQTTFTIQTDGNGSASLVKVLRGEDFPGAGAYALSVHINGNFPDAGTLTILCSDNFGVIVK